MSRDVNHNDAMAEMYARNPDDAVEMIDSYLEDGEVEETFVFLVQVTRAFGLTEDMASQTGLKKNDLCWPIPAGAALPSLEKLRGLLQSVKLHLADKRVPAA